MSRQAMGLVALLGLLLAATGCSACHTLWYEPFGPDSLYDTQRCGPDASCGGAGPACGGACVAGPVRARCAGRGVAAEACAEDCCDLCGVPGCGHRCRILRGPLSAIFALFRWGAYRCCGVGETCSGCGERYWGDWFGDPPEYCDPCDSYGNFTGGGGCSTCGPSASGPAMPTQYAQPSVAPQSGGCRNCGPGISHSYSHRAARPAAQVASSSYRAGRPASPVATSSYRAARPTARAATSSYRTASPAAPSASPYAPRIISTTDEVVKPASAEQAPHLAEPRQDTVQR